MGFDHRRVPTAHDSRTQRRDAEVLFEERRGPTRTFVVIGILAAVVVLSSAIRDVVRGEALIGSAMAALVVLAGLVVVYALVAWAPGSSEFKSVRVDRSGLTVGRQFLPAEEVGHAAVVSEAEASSAALRRRLLGTRIGSKNVSYAYFANSGPAVFVVQERAGLERPGWMIATRDPEGLLAALAELRRRSRKPAR